MDGECDLCGKRTASKRYPHVDICRQCNKSKKTSVVKALIRRANKNFESFDKDVDEGFQIGVLTALRIVCDHERESKNRV